MATTTSTATSAPAAPATSAVAVDPIRVERGNRTTWVAAGVAVVVLATVGLVAARTVSTPEVVPPAGSAVARTDAVESAHGQGSSIRTGAGAAVAAAIPATVAVPSPVVHRTPPKGMVDAATTASTQRSEGPRNVQP